MTILEMLEAGFDPKLHREQSCGLACHLWDETQHLTHKISIEPSRYFSLEIYLVFMGWIPAPAKNYRGKLYYCGYDGNGNGPSPKATEASSTTAGMMEAEKNAWP